MGILKSLLNLAVKTAETAIRQQQNQQRPQQSHNPAPATSTPSYAASSSVQAAPADWNAYFAEIISSAFPQFGVRRNVPVTDLAGYATDNFQLYSTRPMQAYKAEWGAPYTFVLERSGVPAGIVMLGSGHSHDSNVKYLIARMYAKKLGLPYINFYTQMPNERQYVIGRIRKFMGE